MRVLEVGCGTGLFTEFFARSGAQIVGVDISADLLTKARARGLPGEQVQFVEAPLEELDAGDPFDAVIGSSVLHHLPLDVALPRIRDLVRPGGRISFAEPNLLNPQVFLERKLRFLPFFWYVSPDEIAFVRSELRQLLTDHGFADVLVEPFDWLHPATPSALVSAVSQIGRIVERLPALRELAGSLCIRATRPTASTP